MLIVRELSSDTHHSSALPVCIPVHKLASILYMTRQINMTEYLLLAILDGGDGLTV